MDEELRNLKRAAETSGTLQDEIRYFAAAERVDKKAGKLLKRLIKWLRRCFQVVIF